MKIIKRNISRAVSLAGVLVPLLICQPAMAASYFCWDYEVSETGTKGTKGYDYQESGAPNYSATSGTFDTITYNVDGFPKCLGGNSNSKFKSLLSKLESSDFNIVLMQEMFTKDKHSFLRDEDRISKGAYPYRSKHWRGGSLSFGDGLVRLSDFPFDMDNRDDNDYSLKTFESEEYDDCNNDFIGGSVDCLTEKGFTVAVHEITNDFSVHVYNTHMEAGSKSADVKVKQKQFDQLADFINAYSNGVSVVLGGDFNAKWEDNSSKEEYQQVWENFLATTGLRLACQDFTGSSDDSIENCAYDYKADTDQILYRDSNSQYELSLESYEILDFDGVSDHEPNRAVFEWSKR